MKQAIEPLSSPVLGKTHAKARISTIGARAFLVEAQGEFDLAAQRQIWALAALVKTWPHVQEIVPGMTNLLVIFNQIPEDCALVFKALEQGFEQSAGFEPKGRKLEIPVCYGGEYAIDLKALCDYSGLSDKEVVRLHYQAAYRVFALGSAPGFGYLYGLDRRIFMPRKTVPSLKMEKGSLTIGGMQTGIAMLTGPNGWNSIGFAEMSLFDPHAAVPAVMAPGDAVRFVPERIEL